MIPWQTTLRSSGRKTKATPSRQVGINWALWKAASPIGTTQCLHGMSAKRLRVLCNSKMYFFHLNFSDKLLLHLVFKFRISICRRPRMNPHDFLFLMFHAEKCLLVAHLCKPSDTFLIHSPAPRHPSRPPPSFYLSVSSPSPRVDQALRRPYSV